MRSQRTSQLWINPECFHIPGIMGHKRFKFLTDFTQGRSTPLRQESNSISNTRYSALENQRSRTPSCFIILKKAKNSDDSLMPLGIETSTEISIFFGRINQTLSAYGKFMFFLSKYPRSGLQLLNIVSHYRVTLPVNFQKGHTEFTKIIPDHFRCLALSKIFALLLNANAKKKHQYQCIALNSRFAIRILQKVE